ncbi:MAG: flagellar biosynthetic protein FliR, partial [Pseudomonadota bacterium]|nr:flagellar biosynthetic protein FliR [Pseudomonadota bacterium]
MPDLADQITAILLISLRIAPTFAFAPPFTLIRVPASVRLLLSIGLATWLVAANPAQTWQSDFGSRGLFVTAASELFMGIGLALALQLAFAALLTAGRTIDIQAGFGLAMIADPTTQAQMPLVGTLFVYAAAAVFFAIGGPADLLAIWSQSVAQVPLGSATITGNLPGLTAYMSAVFIMAFGVAGLMMLVLFLIDLAITFMSRTMPQMNVLILGFQV